ncbi:MAG: tetratricopeptide repeat protein [Clostridia bacterium]|nr:tetratricopeptide repeat protein [Clostridia bacterium]
MKKRIFIIAYVIVIIIFAKLLLNIIVNEILISKYKGGEYSEEIAYSLTMFNFPEEYIAYYNCGNILYKNKDYNGAIEQYEKALNKYIPRRKECNIRINYALSICAMVQVDEGSVESIKSAIEKYEEAVEVLVKPDCANDYGNGHNSKAQELKDDIEREIERLKQLLEDESSENDKNDNNNESNDDSENNSEEDEIEEKIKDIKQNATKEQRETENVGKNVR